MKMKTKTLHQSVVFETDPHEVYEVLMDSKKHAAFTGAKATIGREVGDSFSVWDEWATGSNVELVPNKKIVQRWRGADWPTGHYSVVRFELKKVDRGTRLDFTQTGIPETLYEEIAKGWKEWYWAKLQAYFTKR
jgi:activator of HSP90 ATPase